MLGADNVRLPLTKAKFTNLRMLDPAGTPYPLLLHYARSLWPDLHLIDDFSLGPGTPFVASRAARIVGYIRKDGIRYGCTSNKKTKADCYAFIAKANIRSPVEISSIFVIQVANKTPQVCAMVRRLMSDDHVPVLPWDL